MQQEIERASGALRDGEMVVMPTDTVYGVAAAAWIPAAIEKLYAVKGRDPGKPIPLLASSLARVVACGAEINAAERKLAEAYWPGALTLVLSTDGSHGLAAREAFRVPDDATALSLLDAVGGVLRVTSANKSGDPPALTAAEARDALGDAVAAVIDAGPAPGGTASTVAEIRSGELVVHREGAIPQKELLAVLAS